MFLEVGYIGCLNKQTEVEVRHQTLFFLQPFCHLLLEMFFKVYSIFFCKCHPCIDWNGSFHEQPKMYGKVAVGLVASQVQPTCQLGPTVRYSRCFCPMFWSRSTFEVRSGRFGSWNLMPWIGAPPNPGCNRGILGWGSEPNILPRSFTQPLKIYHPKRCDVKLPLCTYLKQLKV